MRRNFSIATMCRARRPLPTCLNLSGSRKIPLAMRVGHSKPENIVSEYLAIGVKSLPLRFARHYGLFISLCHCRVERKRGRIRPREILGDYARNLDSSVSVIRAG